jgi:hypothetical protein
VSNILKQRDKQEATMKIEQVEAKVIELIYRKPFTPFVVEFDDGQMIEVPRPKLAITSTGAGFIGPDGALVDIAFDKVRSIRVASTVELS